MYCETWILRVLLQAISDRTMMMPQDIMDTLKQLNLLSYWKGQHFIAAPAKVVEDYWKMYNAPGVCAGGQAAVLGLRGAAHKPCLGGCNRLLPAATG
jgi:hypothetical protein